MKAIDVNKRCCTCKHETDKCVKMSTEQGLELCFDTNEIDASDDVHHFIMSLVDENKRLRMILRVSLWFFIIIAILNLVNIFIN